MRKINLPINSERVESGPIQFNDGFNNDWPGFFLRGDNAAYLAHSIRLLDESKAHAIAWMHLRSIADMIENQVILKKKEV